MHSHSRNARMADGRLFQFHQTSVDRYCKNLYGKYDCFLHRWKALDLSYEWSTILVVSKQQNSKKMRFSCKGHIRPVRLCETHKGLNCIFLYSDAFILLPAHFCVAFSAFMPTLRHVAAPTQGLKSRLDLYCHEPPLDLVTPLFLI